MLENASPSTFGDLATIRPQVQAHVYQFDQGTNAFVPTPILSFPMDYAREQTNDGFTGATANDGDWLPWNDDWRPSYSAFTGGGINGNAQPMLVDIEFDGDGFMTLGFRDRYADQAYAGSDPGPNNGALSNQRFGGDVLLACPDAGGNWQLESGSSCTNGLTGEVRTAGGSADAGPSSPEFYHNDQYLDGATPRYHDETAWGALALLHGSDEIMFTKYDTFSTFEAGTSVFDESDGDRLRAVQIYPGNASFGKAGGIGDVELLADPAPIELGNRIWNDADGNGIQDPGEAIFGNVVVDLWADTDGDGTVDTQVGTTTTDPTTGEYYFNSSNVNMNGATEIEINTAYEIRVDLTQGVLGGAVPTLVDAPQPANGNVSATNNDPFTDVADSDAVLHGTVPDTAVIAHTTGWAGSNNHGLDIGLTPPASIGDFVWNDVNADGIQDAGELGIGGVTVDLYDGGGNFIATTTTAADGSYSFTNLPPGDYYLEFSTPSGYGPSPQDQGGDDGLDSDPDPTNGRTATTTLISGENDVSWDAGFYRVYALGDFVWLDLNADGVQDGGAEVGIAGVRVFLDLDNDNTYDAGIEPFDITDGSGLYLISDLAAGTYTVRVDTTTLPPGYLQTYDLDLVLDQETVVVLPDDINGETAGVFTTSNVLGDCIAGVRPCPDPYPDVMTYSALNGNDNAYNVFIGGDFTAIDGSAEAEGRVFVYGDFNMDKTSGIYNVGYVGVGTFVVPDDLTDYLIVGGDINVPNHTNANGIRVEVGGVTAFGDNARGNVRYAGAINPTGDATYPDPVEVNAAASIINDPALDLSPFDATFANLADGSSCWSAISSPVTHGTVTTTGSRITFASTDGAARTYIFNVNTDIDSNYDGTGSGVEIAFDNFPANATIIINMNKAGSGDSIQITSGEFFVDGVQLNIAGGGQSAENALMENVLWNFPDADDVTITAGYNLQFRGAILVPSRTSTTTLNVSTNGRFVAGGDVIQGANNGLEFHNFPFSGSLPSCVFVDADFGYVQPASIGDFVWEDTNANGIQDAGEIGIGGVTVDLYDGGNNFIATTTSAADGSYSFTGLIPGDYYVDFAAPAGFIPSPQDQGGDDTVDSDADTTTGQTAVTTLDPGENDPTWDAGFYQLASIGDFVWNDVNANGIQDAGELGIGGVTVDLYDGGGNFIATTTTAADGSYGFTNLIPGDYYVDFTTPAGYDPSPQDQGGDDTVDSDADTTSGETAVTTLTSGENDLTWDAGFYQPAAIGDFVWSDLNGDGIQDAGEPGIGGVTVDLYDSGGNFIATTTTAADGSYNFTGLVPGDYYVDFATPTGYMPSPQDQGGDDTVDSDADTTNGQTAVTTLTAGENDITWDAGFIPLASIGDFVWEDLNADGIQDAGELGIGGVTVDLYDGGGNFVATTTTAADGSYGFTDLVPGDYYVDFTAPVGYVASPQDQGGDDTVDSDADTTSGETIVTTLVPGENDPTWDAGFYQLASIGDYVWSDLNADGIQDAGELGVGGVTVDLYDGGGNFVATTTTAADGSYSFTNLIPGDYYVDFTLPSGYMFSPQDQGGDDSVDSDADTTTGDCQPQQL